MRVKLVALPLVVALLAATLAAAQPPTPLVLRCGDEVKVVAVYPLEVKYGSWARVVLDLTALRNITVGEFRVKVVLVTERGSAVLLDRKLLTGLSMARGDELQWTLEFQAAVPQPPVEPFLELYLYLSYSVNATARVLEYKAPITIVPPQTYSELSSALASAQAKAALADQLSKQLEDLKARYAAEANRSALLASELQRARAENAELRARLEALLAENSYLRANISALLSQVARLSSENSALRAEVSSLQEQLASLRSQHSMLQSQYSAAAGELQLLRGTYEKLLSESSLLKGVLAALAAALLAVGVVKWGARRKASLPPPPPPPPP